MNIQEITQILTSSGKERNESERIVQMLAEHFCNYTEIDRIKGRNLLPEELDLLKNKARIIAEENIPVQYVTGKAWFMGEYYKVNESVLIPRDETELLVREAIDIINRNEFKTVLDIGTGSGCIACSIAKNTQATVLGVDVSTEALEVALDNVSALGLNNKAVFRKSDLFQKLYEDEKFDIIISNPPYISKNEILDEEVLKEPNTALFAGNNGLEFYEKIINGVSKHINAGGYIMFELGIGQAEKVRNMLLSEFAEIRIIKDLADIDRVIIGKYMK